MSRTSERLLVFARGPIPGSTKTRLIPLLGADGAAALHARLVKHTLETARRTPLPLELHGEPADDTFLQSCAEQYGARLVPQSEGDLGVRMHAALDAALAQCRRALLIGTDCPALGARHLRAAAHALAAGNEAVFIPTEDGGYALVGLLRCDRRLFRDVPWGTAEVMAATRTRLRALGWRWAELDTLWDVDRPDDYARLQASGLLDSQRRERRRA